MSFVRFLAACYLTFNMDCLTVAKALETLPVLPLLHQVTGAPGWTPYCTACAQTKCILAAYAGPIGDAFVTAGWFLSCSQNVARHTAVPID